MKLTKRGGMLGVATVLVISMIAVALPFRTSLVHALKLATTHQPERFSELYFAQPDMLPKNLHIGEIADVGFVVTNHEDGQHTYRYQVVFMLDGQAMATRTGAFTLEDQQSTTQKVTIPAQSTPGQLRIIIRLVDKDQTIHFRTEISL